MERDRGRQTSAGPEGVSDGVFGKDQLRAPANPARLRTEALGSPLLAAAAASL